MPNDHKDLPSREIQAHAALNVARNGGPQRCRVFFKYTCAHCGSRQTFMEPNTIYDSGECSKCGTETKIKKYGYLLEITSGGGFDDKERDSRDGGKGSGSGTGSH